MLARRLKGVIPGVFNETSAAHLASRLAYFPLYMVHVVSFIEASRLSLDEFYQFSLEGTDPDREWQQLATEALWNSDSVARAMEAHMARRLTPQDKIVLKTMAFFDPDQIPERLLLSVTLSCWTISTPLGCQDVLNRLSRYSLVDFHKRGDGGERFVGMHRLVRDAALRLDGSTQAAFDNAVHLLRHAFPLQGLARDHMVEDWAECEAFQPHVLALHQRYLELQRREPIDISYDFLELVYSCAWYFSSPLAPTDPSPVLGLTLFTGTSASAVVLK